MAEKKNGLGSAAAGLLRPTTQPEPPASPPAATPDEGQGGDPTISLKDETGQGEGKARAPRRRKGAAPTSAKLEGRRLYLSESTHFRLRMLAYQRGQKLSEVAEELLDKSLPKWDVTRVG